MPKELYGREAALQPVRRMLASVQAGRAVTVLVEGSTGSGKTSLLGAAAGEAQRRGVCTAWAPADVAALAANQPRLILVDDAHQMTRRDLAALLRAVTRGPADPVALMLALRGSADPVGLNWLLHTVRPRPVRVVLTALDRQAVTRLCTDVFGAPPDPELAAWMLSAGGDPRITRALAEGLIEEGQVRPRYGRAALAPVGGGSGRVLPQRVHDIVRSRLAAMTAQSRQLLRTAAVIGPRLVPEDLAEMLGQSTAALLPAWDEALAGDFFRRDGDDIVFAHEVLRQAVAESLPATIRVALRRQRGRLGTDPTNRAPATDPGTSPAIGLVASPVSSPTAPAERPDRPPVAEADPGRLTHREQSVLALLTRGYSNQQIARALGLSIHAVKRHISMLLIKFNCSNRTEVALAATKPRRTGTAAPPDRVTSI